MLSTGIFLALLGYVASTPQNTPGSPGPPPSTLPTSLACQPVDPCNSEFLLKDLIIKDAIILDLTTTWVVNATVSGSNGKISYCNAQVKYTHTGWNDTTNVQILLPATRNWNGRFQGIGGGGWAASSGISSLMPPLGQNYSTGNTDAGHNPNLPNSASWWKDANGNIDVNLLKDFASVGLGDLAYIGKQLSKRYYGYGPVHSYWNGCSTGGRQGWMMAQAYPDAYDGIYAGSPAAQWDRFQVAQYWGQFLMNSFRHWPNQCVFNAFTNAVVSACDALDGVTDSVIANFDACKSKFDTKSLIGTRVLCSGTNITITETDAEIAAKVWEGPRASDGSFVWWGIQPGTPFSGLTGTSCQTPTNCTGSPFSITSDWMTRWCLEDETFDLTKLTLDGFVDVFNKCKAKYEGIIGTNDVDLGAFARRGKMISWHGQADQLIYPSQSGDYYQRAFGQGSEPEGLFPLLLCSRRAALRRRER